MLVMFKNKAEMTEEDKKKAKLQMIGLSAFVAGFIVIFMM